MRDHAKGGALTEVTFFVLLALYTPRHGYAVMQFVENATAGRLALGAGTLYGALNALLERGWIAPHPADDERRRQYRITPAGRAAAGRELQRLRVVANFAQTIIGEERS